MGLIKKVKKSILKEYSGLNLLLLLSGIILGMMNLSAAIFRLLEYSDIVSVKTNYIPIAPVTILFFLLFSAFFIYSGLNSKKIDSKRTVTAVFGLIAVYGLLQFCTYFVNIDLTLNSQIFPDAHFIGKFPVNYMSPYTGFLFFVSSASIILVRFFRKKNIANDIAAIFGLIISFAGFVASMGYLYNTPFLYSGTIIPISKLASISFIFLGCALIFYSGKNTALMHIFIGKTASARMLRIIIPLVISFFVLQGIINTYFSKTYNISPALLQALITVISVVTAIVVVIYISNKVFKSANRSERERLHALEELKRISHLQSLILNNSSLGIFMVKDNVVQWHNSKFLEIFNIKSEEIVNFSPEKLVQKSEDFIKIRDLFRTILSETRSLDERVKLDIHSGNTLWCRFIGSMLDHDNPTAGTIWLVEDITERHLLRDRMRLLSATVDSLSECVSITDTSNNIIFLNKTFLKTYGYKSEELIGKNIEIVSSPNNLPNIHKEILSDTIDGEWFGELLNRRKDGTEFPIFLASSKVINDKNEVIALVGISKDITESKAAEAKLKTYAEELRIANNAKDKLFSIISHDLRGPFSSIINFFQLFSEQYDNFTEKEKKDYLDKIKKFAEKSFELLENLLIWSSAQRGGIKISPENINLYEIVNNQIELLRNYASEKGIAINNSVDKEFYVFVDKNMIKTVLRNLISNAIKFTNIAGSVTISALSDENDTQITIKDTGVGIEKSVIDNIFSFEKVSSTYGTSNEKGTGLGLQICKEFIENSGGRIWVESEKNRGSKFIFTIPSIKS